MKQLLLVGVGGFLGAILRFAVSGWVQQGLGQTKFPVGTFVVNSLGAFALGVLY